MALSSLNLYHLVPVAVTIPDFISKFLGLDGPCGLMQSVQPNSVQAWPKEGWVMPSKYHVL